MLLNNEWVSNKIKNEIKRCLETRENEDTTIQNLWDTGKAILREKFMTLQAYLKKTRENSNKQSNFTLKLEKEQQIKPKVSRRKEIIQIRTEINETESKK